MKNKLIFIFSYCLISLPFIITAFINEWLVFGLKFLIIIALLSYGGIKRQSNKEIMVAVLFVLYFFIHSIINPAYIKQVLLVLPDFAFLYVSICLLKRDPILCHKLLNTTVSFSLVVALLIFVTKFLYTHTPFLFTARDVDGYPTFFNPLLGIVSPGKDRPSWYFAEPSYSGFFLGLLFFLVATTDLGTKKQKLLRLLVLGLGIYATASLGTYVYVLIAIPFCFLNGPKVNKKLITALVLLIVFFVYQASSSFDLFGVEQEYFDLMSHGAEGRQGRMDNALEIMSQGSILNTLFGNGLECVVLTYKEGISDAYHKLVCEWGVIFTFGFIYAVWFWTKKNVPVFVFIMASFFSVIIHMTPIVVLFYFLVYYTSNLNKVGNKVYSYV